MNKIRKLRPADLPDCLELSRQAGWNQTEADWARFLTLAPDSCFGIELDDRVVSVTTAICHGADLAWIGMVLTHPDFRGKGLAAALFRHTVEWLRTKRIRWTKLDATDMGQPLYSKFGFQEQCAIERWRRPAGGFTPAGKLLVYDYVADPSFDRACFGAARIGLLTALAPEGAAFCPGGGYALARPGRLASYFGPCVVRNPEAARSLLEWFLKRHSRDDAFWDLFPANAHAVALARDYGFEPVRRLRRMALPARPGEAPLLWSQTSVFAIAGFEYG